jgi:hypothetical protein
MRKGLSSEPRRYLFLDIVAWIDLGGEVAR